jgi:pilus assembly protein CpaE
MDINMPDMDGIAASHEITRVAPMCQVVMMSVQSEADYLRRSMLAGAMDFLTKPFTSVELGNSIRQVYEMGASRRKAMPSAPAFAEGGAPGLVDPSHGPVRRGKLLTIYSPKGGTGCSTVATNLAIAVVQLTSAKVVLVDASLQFGDVDVLLNLQGDRSIANATERIDEMDSDLLESILVAHPSGIRVLTAPPAPEISETITPEKIKQILTMLRKQFDYVLVDTWSYLDDVILTAMEMADRILLVVTPELPSIKSTKQFLEVAEALHFPLEQMDLILNKALPRDGIRAEQLESSIRHEIRTILAFDPKSIRQTTNQGVPLMMAQPNHPLSESLLALAQKEIAALDPQPVEEAEPDPVPLTEGRKRRSGFFARFAG